MRRLHNFLFRVCFLLGAPYYFWKMWRRGGWRAAFGERFGHYDPAVLAPLRGGPVLWLHAVSVGEVNLALQLVGGLRTALPGWRLLVSTTTATGRAELEKKLPPEVARIYYPVDFAGVVRRALQAVNPAAVVLVEAEFWPNLLWQIKDRGLPLALVNARLSDRSYRGYRRFARLFGPIFRSFDAVGVQTEADERRWRELGCRAETIQVTGNVKFDGVRLEVPQATDFAELLGRIGVPATARVLVGGSTHAGEEVLLARIHQALRREFPDLFLILVPRHMERARAAAEEVRRLGLRVLLRTEIGTSVGEVDCLMVNTTGELPDVYRVATLVFVGKSLTAEGGQNPIEPAALGKAVLVGPHMQNFRAIVAQFVAAHAMVQVTDEAELRRRLAELLRDDAQRTSLGQAARAVVERNQGAVGRTIALLAKLLRRDGVERVADASR